MNRADCPTVQEEQLLRQHLAECEPRAALLVELGLEAGLRLSELLGLKVGDVWHAGQPKSVLRVMRHALKGGHGVRRRSVRNRQIPLNAAARTALMNCLGQLGTNSGADAPLFPSQKGGGHLPIQRRHGGRLIKKIFLGAGLDPSPVWAGHSLRRRFVRRLYAATRDICLVRTAIGQSSIGNHAIIPRV